MLHCGLHFDGKGLGVSVSEIFYMVLLLGSHLEILRFFVLNWVHSQEVAVV